jgi:hypothetical protein
MTVPFFAPSSWFIDGNASVANVSFNSGDEVFIIGFTGDGASTLATPTGTGLGTVTLVTSIVGAAGVDAVAYLWRATATSTQASTTISATRQGSVDNQCGIGAWVVAGGVTAVTALTGNTNESAYAGVSTGAGDIVLYGLGDWNATLPNKDALTGSGTITDDVFNVNSGVDYGAWGCTWENTAAGSFTFGPNNYTGLAVVQVGAVITPATIVAVLAQTHYRFGVSGTEAGHAWEAAEDTTISKSVGYTGLARMQTDETAGAAKTFKRGWQYRQVGDPNIEWRLVKP